MSELQEAIKRLRRERDWTQEQLAEKCRVTRQTIGNAEGGRGGISESTLSALCEAFEIETWELHKLASSLKSNSKKRSFTKLSTIEEGRSA